MTGPVAALQKGCGGFGESAEEFDLNPLWITVYQLQGEVGQTWIVISGTPEVEVRSDSRI